MSTGMHCQDCGFEMVAIQGPGELTTIKCLHCGEGWNEKPAAAGLKPEETP